MHFLFQRFVAAHFTAYEYVFSLLLSFSFSRCQPPPFRSPDAVPPDSVAESLCMCCLNCCNVVALHVRDSSFAFYVASVSNSCEFSLERKIKSAHSHTHTLTHAINEIKENKLMTLYLRIIVICVCATFMCMREQSYARPMHAIAMRHSNECVCCMRLSVSYVTRCLFSHFDLPERKPFLFSATFLIFESTRDKKGTKKRAVRSRLPLVQNKKIEIALLVSSYFGNRE